MTDDDHTTREQAMQEEAARLRAEAKGKRIEVQVWQPDGTGVRLELPGPNDERWLAAIADGFVKERQRLEEQLALAKADAASVRESLEAEKKIAADALASAERRAKERDEARAQERHYLSAAEEWEQRALTAEGKEDVLRAEVKRWQEDSACRQHRIEVLEEERDEAREERDEAERRGELARKLRASIPSCFSPARQEFADLLAEIDALPPARAALAEEEGEEEDRSFDDEAELERERRIMAEGPGPEDE